MESTIPNSRVLDHVIEILKESHRPMVAREICEHLFTRGIRIDRFPLNKILWAPHNRPGLKVEPNTFRWRYELPPEIQSLELKSKKAVKELNKIQIQTSQQTELLALLEGFGLEMLSVKRRGNDTTFFLLRSDDDCVLMIGPHGNLLREKADICTDPESTSVQAFTGAQVQTAIEETVKFQHAQFEEHNKQVVLAMRDTELLVGDVYLGQPVEPVLESIPVDSIIFVENITRFDCHKIALGPGTALQPLFLIINLLGFGVDSDKRYGAYKICVYELIKNRIAIEAPGGLELQVSFVNGKVALGPEANQVFLEPAYQLT